jgi:serine O-acetyltransferase
MLMADLKRKRDLYNNDGARMGFFRTMISDGTSAIVCYRMMRFLSKYSLLMPMAYVAQYLNKIINGCLIGVHADFGAGFVIMHPTGVVINSKVRGGINVTVESSVVIGDEKGRSPVLENNVFVGSGAKIIGGVTVGSNTKIGANAVIVKDVPSNSTAVGVPARYIGTQAG